MLADVGRVYFAPLGNSYALCELHGDSRMDYIF